MTSWYADEYERDGLPDWCPLCGERDPGSPCTNEDICPLGADYMPSDGISRPDDHDERVIPCEVCGGDGGGEGPPRRWSTDGSGDWIKCTACDGTGEQVIVLEPVTQEDIEVERRVPVERMSLGDWRRLMESTPGRLPTCGEMGRASEQCSSEWGFYK